MQEIVRVGVGCAARARPPTPSARAAPPARRQVCQSCAALLARMLWGAVLINGCMLLAKCGEASEASPRGPHAQQWLQRTLAGPAKSHMEAGAGSEAVC